MILSLFLCSVRVISLIRILITYIWYNAIDFLCLNMFTSYMTHGEELKIMSKIIKQFYVFKISTLAYLKTFWYLSESSCLFHSYWNRSKKFYFHNLNVEITTDRYASYFFGPIDDGRVEIFQSVENYMKIDPCEICFFFRINTAERYYRVSYF